MSHFFAYLSRMKLIQRWGLMRNTFSENIQEHSHRVATIAHCMALIKNKHYKGNVNPERVALLALYHDVSEVITGDLPTPVKYFSQKIKSAYKEIEKMASDKILGLIPEELKTDYEDLFFPKEAEHDLWQIVKAADKICAYLKCLEERRAGNQEFIQAEKQIRDTINSLKQPEVKHFLEKFVPSFSLSLDELNEPRV